MMPKSQLGRYAVMLLAGSVVFFGFASLAVASGQTGGDTFLDNLWISIPMFLAAICAIASFGLGTKSVVRNRERSLLVYLGCLVGFFVLIFIAGEIIFPH